MAQSGYDFRGMQPQGAADNWTFTARQMEGGGGDTGLDGAVAGAPTWTNTTTGEIYKGEAPPGWSVYTQGQASGGAPILQSPDGKFYLQPGGGWQKGSLQPLSLTLAQAEQLRTADNDSNSAYQNRSTWTDTLRPGLINTAAFIGAGMGLNALTGAGSLGTAGTMSSGLGDLAAYESAAGGAATGGLEGALRGASGLAGSGITDEMLLTGMAPEAGGTAAGTVANGFSGAGAGLFGSGVPGGSWLTGSLGGAGTASTSGSTSIWDDISKALGITSTTAGAGKGLSDILGGLFGAYGANQTADKYAEAMKYAVDKADPFASQRPQYQTMFSDMNTGKVNPMETPWMKNLTNTAVDQSAQRLTSKYGGDVSSLGLRNTIANNVNATNAPVMQDYLKTIGNAAGMNIQPNAGTVAAGGAAGSVPLNNQIWGQGMYAGRSALDMLFGSNKSANQQNGGGI